MAGDTKSKPPKRKRVEFEEDEPYSLEKLELALALFRKTKPRLTNCRALRTDPSYNLRARQSNGLGSTDLEVVDDNKDDENYQPRKGSSRKKKPKKSNVLANQPSQSRIMKISFSSIDGKILLQKLKHVSIFDDWVDYDDDDQIETMPSKRGSSNEDVYAQDPPEAVIRNIRTAFSHPIDCELGSNCGDICQFCADFTFGMFGLGFKDVEVIDHGTFFEEIEGGHREDGHEPTRICNSCALKRLHIMNCGGHEMSIIPNCDPHTFDYFRAFNSIEELEDDSGRREQINQWCSFCINPAFFRCCTIQVVDIFGDDLDPSSPDAEGCGLLLCESCRALMEVHKGDIARVIAAIPASEGKRADIEFLIKGSDLNRYFSE